MRVIVITGRSGSGKSSALELLEDEGFTCIDNFPAKLLPPLLDEYASAQTKKVTQALAVGIDVRNLTSDFTSVHDILRELADKPGIDIELIYLDARSSSLLRRFSETRRKHPLTDESTSLSEAIELEDQILQPLATIASRTIDTTSLSLHQLRSLIKDTVVPDKQGHMAILFESFGFKKGVPIDADFVFDLRALPNPYWRHELREHSGLEAPVVEFLESQREVAQMLADVIGFLTRWIPSFQSNNRAYLTIAIGCTGGKHRSVYMAHRLRQHFAQMYPVVQEVHRELNG